MPNTCAKSPSRNRKFQMVLWETISLTENILRMYFLLIIKKNIKHICFWQHCLKKMGSIKEYRASHFTKWNKVILFNFRNGSPQTNGKCHLDLFCINRNNFSDKHQGWNAKSVCFLSCFASTELPGWGGNVLLNGQSSILLKDYALTMVCFCLVFEDQGSCHFLLDGWIILLSKRKTDLYVPC